MASAEPTESSDKLTCTICHEFYNEPKLLPCAHLLCRHCLLSWMQSNKDASCPLCRSPVVEGDSRGSVSLDDVADGLPTDLSMVRLVEAERLLNKQHQCCGCNQVVATCLCLNCRDMMCKACAKVHKNFSVTKDHVIEELCDLTAEKIAANHRSPACAYHPDEVCNLYCPTHDEPMCHVCGMTRHRSCQELKEMKEKMSEARAVLAELVTRLNEGQSAINQGIQELDEHLKNTEKKTQALFQQIDQLCDKLDSLVKECRRHLKEKVHKASSEVKEAVHEGKTHLLQRKGKLTCHKIVTERIQEMKAQKEVRTMSAVMKARVDDMDFSATLPADAKVVPTLTLEINAEAVSNCEKYLRELGTVSSHAADLKAQPKASVWTFHDNHGKNIALSNNNQTADRVTGQTPYHGIVMSCNPLEINTLYQVEVNEVLSKWNYQHMMLGVTVQAPHTISLPGHIMGGHPSAMLISHDRVLNQGTEKSSNLGAPLRDVRSGSRVGLMLDDQRDVHLYVDSRDLGVFASAVPQPCFFIMDLHACWKKATTLPLERVKKIY